MTTGEAIGAVFATYAAKHGKPRWGDKTPAYMRHLPLLERLFPDARVRAPRSATAATARSPFSGCPTRRRTRTWAHPDERGRVRVPVGDGDRRCAGARLAESARVAYLEVRYEELVAEPAAVVATSLRVRRRSRSSLRMLEPERGRRSHRSRTTGACSRRRARRRDWRVEMRGEDVRAFEAIAGELLADLGYELADRGHARLGKRARLELGWYRARIAAWKATAYLGQRSPLWRRRHPQLHEG